MDIKDLAELSKVIDLCRKKGIETLKLNKETIEFTLKEGFEAPKRRRRGKEQLQDNTEILIELPKTEEEILFWSAGLPENGGN